MRCSRTRGKKGEQHQEKEVKIETVFPAYIQTRLIKALIQAHPYEEVAYDILSLENSNQYIGAGIVGELQKPEGLLEPLNQVLDLQAEIFGAGTIF